MRITLSLDDDVAAELEALRRRETFAFRDIGDVINEALRRGVQEILAERGTGTTFRTRLYDCGACLVSDLGKIAKVLDGEDDKHFNR
jgi:hypothetical protein